MVKKIIKAVLFSACFFSFAFAQQPPAQKLELNYFFSPTCHVCHEVRETIIAQIGQKYKDRVSMNFRDISSIEEYKTLLALKEKFGFSQNGTIPVVFFSGRLLVGKEEISAGIFKLVDEEIAAGRFQKHETPHKDLFKYFLSFTPATVISAGLIDGINPCAFTVIVFFISFLALQGYRKKELAGVGLFFIFAVFLTYLLIGLGVFSFFYSLKGFWAARKVFNLAIGSLSIVFGILATVDFIKFKISGKTEGMALQLPQAVKNQIHKVISSNYRKDKAGSLGAPAETMAKLCVTAMVTGFLVSILEAVCTGQVYLPTITFVLKTTNIKIKAFSYLVLYNLMFVLPLFVIFLCALMGTTSEDFSRFMKKHFLATKVLMAVLFFVLGAYLIWRA